MIFAGRALELSSRTLDRLQAARGQRIVRTLSGRLKTAFVQAAQ